MDTAARPQPADRPLRIACVMEQVLGHVSWSQQLRRAFSQTEGIDARFVETSLYDAAGTIERVPGIPGVIRSGVRARLDVRRALAQWGSWRPDVFLFNTQKPAALCQPELLRTPALLMTDVTPRQYDRLAALYEHCPDRGIAAQVKHAVNVMNFRLARGVVPWSNWTRSSLLAEYGVPPERAHVIPPGVDTSLWQPATASISDVGRRETARLLFVGGNFERKGGRLLLDVFRSLKLADRAELHVVTRDPVPPLAGLVVHHGLTNNSDALVRLYQEADVFVLPTRADCFSIASIEAMAAGLPVVTTDMGGIGDIVVEGENGYLVPPGDGRELGVALSRLVEDVDHRRAMGARGRQRAVHHFDATRNAARIADLARRVARRPVPAPQVAQPLLNHG